MSDLTELRDQMRTFTTERDWAGYHDPKSLILALVGEVGELSELFQWLPAEQAAKLAAAEPLRRECSDELADVLLYLTRLADVLEIDPVAAAAQKMSRNRARHRPGDPPKGLRSEGFD